jgi:hypothetical protein
MNMFPQKATTAFNRSEVRHYVPVDFGDGYGTHASLAMKLANPRERVVYVR